MTAGRPDHHEALAPTGSRRTRGAVLDVSADETTWLATGMEADLRPRMRDARARGEAFVLATLAVADGGPRPVGSQMVITAGSSSGFVSGGCVEADVRLHARETLADGRFREVVYGKGSPFADIRLPCGGSLTVRMERLQPDDRALDALLEDPAARRSLTYFSDGTTRGVCLGDDPGPDDPLIVKRFTPSQRLVVVGGDPFALAMAALARTIDWEVTLVRPKGPSTPPPLEIDYRTDEVTEALIALRPDRWTAVAIASHDRDLDDTAVMAALGSAASYVGVLGSRRRIQDRRDRLAARGMDLATLDRLRAPIGLEIGASSPWEVAVSVLAGIIAEQRP